MTGGLSPGAGGVGGASASEGMVLVSAMGAVVVTILLPFAARA